jgi:hypothetical protein
MQVERSSQEESGGRVRNTWVIYLRVRNTGEKSPTIPHSLRKKESSQERREMSLRLIS